MPFCASRSRRRTTRLSAQLDSAFASRRIAACPRPRTVADDDVGVPRRGGERGDQLGRMLAVGVQHDHGVGRGRQGLAHAGADGGALAVVGAHPHHAHARSRAARSSSSTTAAGAPSSTRITSSTCGSVLAVTAATWSDLKTGITAVSRSIGGCAATVSARRRSARASGTRATSASVPIASSAR